MKTRLLIVLLFGLLSACNGNGRREGCPSVWVDCSGTANDVMICSNCLLVDQCMENEMRKYRWYNCEGRPQLKEDFAAADCIVYELEEN